MTVNGYPHDYHGNQFTWWVGRVEATTEPELNDPEAVNRVRVRIFGFQDMEFPVEDLPLCTVIMPPTVGYGYGGGGQVHGLHKMDIVTGFFMDHDMQMPVVTGVIMGQPITDDELGWSSGGGSGGSSSTSSPSSTTASTESSPSPVTQPTTSAAKSKPSVQNAESSTVSTRADGAEFNTTGVEGATTDKSVPATLRHNNPLGNNMAGLANRFDAQTSQNLDGTNTIASFADTSDGYAYSYAQMALNAERLGQYENGRLYTTPQQMGDGHRTPGYNGSDIVADVGNNNRMYFDTYSDNWYAATNSMQQRETSNSLRNRTITNNDLPSTYDYGQNRGQAERGFTKMKEYKGL